MERHVGSCTVEQCSIAALVRAGRLRVLPVGVFAWRGEPEPCVSLCGSMSIRAVPHSCGALDPALRPLCVGPALVGEGNYSRERVVGGRDSSCQQVVEGEAESPRARRRLVGRDGDSSCGSESVRARRRLVGEDRALSCEAETCRGSHLPVGGEASL
jgi:hypothetical protein